MSTKTITNPNGPGSVKVPVIDEITFTDAPGRGQEITFTFYNAPDDPADRKVHVVRVTDSSGGSGYLDVERIDMFQTIDTPSRGQEERYEPDNVTGEETKPPHFVSHTKTHVKRLHSENGPSYIDTERIDEIIFKDVPDRGQETHFYLAAWDDEQDQ